jgi:hypothetical protein
VKLGAPSWNLAQFETKQTATDFAVEYAERRQPSQVIVHNADGTIAAEWTYGNNSCPPAGHQEKP